MEEQASQSTSPSLHPGRYQTWDGQPVIVLYRLREHWYGHFAAKDPKRNLEQWHRDGRHAGNSDWNLKILAVDRKRTDLIAVGRE